MTKIWRKEVRVTSRPAATVFLLCFAIFAASQDSRPTPDLAPDDAMQSLLIRKVNPVYSPLARQARIQGTVILKIVISKSGSVQSLQLVKGHPMLAPAAFDAVRRWKYRSYLSNGEAVEVETNVQLNFVLGPQSVAEGIAGDAPGGLPPGTIGSVTTEPQTDPRTRKRTRVSESVMQALLIHKVDPVYPDERVHIRGTVVLKAAIDKSGNIENLQVFSGHPMLIPAAIEAAKQWKYQPFLLNGNPVEVETTLHVDFATPKPKWTAEVSHCVIQSIPF